MLKQATTFHKAQGATFDNKKTVAEVQMGLKPKHEMVGCAYVALSRTINTENLSITPTKDGVGNDIDMDLKNNFDLRIIPPFVNGMKRDECLWA